MKQYVTVGLSVLAGAAILEAALVPGVVIGGAAILAPKLLPALRRNLRPLFKSTARRRPRPAPSLMDRLSLPALKAPLATLRLERSVAKTITFRVIVTSLDFTVNYLVLGELATAAGLSAFALVAGPLFYLVHEMGWNYFGARQSLDGASAPSVENPNVTVRLIGGRELVLDQALAKTITYRTVATITDFTATYIIVGDLATAAGLSAFGFVLGPFVYLGHEKIWDHYSPPEARALEAKMLEVQMLEAQMLEAQMLEAPAPANPA